jgi:hypothetical protein
MLDERRKASAATGSAIKQYFLLFQIPAMHKTGQWCCLIYLKDISAILRFAFNKHWRSVLREELRLLRCAR